MTENQTPVPKSTPRWLKLTLILSLAANLGVAGVIGGAALRAPNLQRNTIEAPEGVAMLARAMPLAHQRELRETLRTGRDNLRPDRQELRLLRDRFIAALKAEPFDIDDVNSVFADQREMLSKLTAAGHDAVIEQIETMNSQDREAYIKRLLGNDQHPTNRQPPPRK